MATDWRRQSARLIRSYKPGPKGRELVDEYRRALALGLGAGSIDEHSASILTAAGNYLDAWTVDKPDVAAAFQQWMELWTARERGIPTEIIDAFLARFPRTKPGEFNWAPIIFGAETRSTINELLDRRLVKVQDLARMAKNEPADFVKSPALDVLLQRGVPAPRLIWKQLAESPTRAEGLMSAGSALVRSYSLDVKPDASRWLAGFLGESSSVREPALRVLLRSPFPGFRFAHHIAFDHAAMPKAKAKRIAAANAPLIADWVAICSEAIESNSEAEPSAKLVLGMFQLAVAAGSRTLTTESGATIRAVADRVAEKSTVATLRKIESKSSRSESDAIPVVINGDRLYESVQSYLRALPLSGNDGESPERALKLERHLARKELIGALIEVLDGETGTDLRDTIEALLFNSGVRPNGLIGEHVVFDVHVHESDTPGLLKNDAVIVTKPGRLLGTPPDGIVLTKAKVTPAPESSGIELG